MSRPATPRRPPGSRTHPRPAALAAFEPGLLPEDLVCGNDGRAGNGDNWFLIGILLVAIVAFQPEIRRALIRLGQARVMQDDAAQSQCRARHDRFGQGFIGFVFSFINQGVGGGVDDDIHRAGSTHQGTCAVRFRQVVHSTTPLKTTEPATQISAIQAAGERFILSFLRFYVHSIRNKHPCQLAHTGNGVIGCRLRRIIGYPDGAHS